MVGLGRGRGREKPRAGPAVTTVLLADDQRVIREGLELMLGLIDGIQVVGAAADGAEAIELTRRLEPDVLLVDLHMPGIDGVGATKAVRALPKPPAVVVLTTMDDRETILSALRAGALGYLTKDADAAAIGDAIFSAAAGRSLLAGEVQAALISAVGEPVAAAPSREPAGLTAREAEVLTLIARGRSNREIARDLVVSEATVKTHVNHLLAKIGARDRAQAVTFAYQHGLV